ncbi:MAG: CBS domain-containing protein [Balneolaceae bacterium]|nr:CBS domain-containing protein [Balneolaceae bacterium]
MLARNLLNTDFKPLRPDSPVSMALAKMDAWQSSSIPVVESVTNTCVGHILFDDIAEFADESTPISETELRNPIYVNENQHIFEIARLMLQHEVRLISVVDDTGGYIGIIEIKQVLEALSTMLNIGTAGSVITIQMFKADFTLAELVHLIETEGAKILGLTVEQPDMDDSVIRISIKLSLKDTSAIVSSLQRHGYLTTTENRNDIYQMDMTSRADELMRYLDL